MNNRGMNNPNLIPARLKQWFQQTGSLALGWILVSVGVALLLVPGPGTLVLLAGVALLAQHHAWAKRLFDPLKAKSVTAAKRGVESPWRIGLSAAGALWLVGMGLLWLASPSIPVLDLWGLQIGPRLPGGTAAGVGLLTSGLLASFLLGYSVWRWRPRRSTSG